jgi:aconitate hydratase
MDLYAKKTPGDYQQEYAEIFTGPIDWRQIEARKTPTYKWEDNGTYIRRPPMPENIRPEPPKLHDIKNGYVLALIGDDISADQLDPMGPISKESPAGAYLLAAGVAEGELDSFKQRRCNPEVAMRGILADPSVKNELVPDAPAGSALFPRTKAILPLSEMAEQCRKDNTPLILIAGKNFGTGEGRIASAKRLGFLGVKAVVAESFDPDYRAALVRANILPLQFKGEMTRKNLNLKGDETVGVAGASVELRPHMDMILTFSGPVSLERFIVRCAIETAEEAEYYRNGGLFSFVVREIYRKAQT